MAIPRIPAASVEYLKVPVTGPAGLDLTDLDVDLAVIPDGETLDTGDWEPGVWSSDGRDAMVLIGAGGLVLTPGTYDVYVRVTSTPEIPVLLSGSIHIT